MTYNKKLAKFILIITLITTTLLTTQFVEARSFEDITEGIITEAGETFEIEIPTETEPDYIRTITSDEIKEIEAETINDTVIIKFEVDSEAEQGISTIHTILYYEEEGEPTSYDPQRYYTIVGISIPSTGLITETIEDLKELKETTDTRFAEKSGFINELTEEMEAMETDIEDINETLKNIEETMEKLAEKAETDVTGIGNIIIRSSKYLGIILLLAIVFFVFKKIREDDDEEFAKPTDFSP